MSDGIEISVYAPFQETQVRGAWVRRDICKHVGLVIAATAADIFGQLRHAEGRCRERL